MKKSGLVIGMGNPILSDDGVGLYVAKEIERLWTSVQTDIDVDHTNAVEWRFMEFDGNPLDLVDLLYGVDLLVVIDAWYPNDGGPVCVLRLDRAAGSMQAISATDSHGMNLLDTIVLGSQLGLTDPGEVWLVLVPVNDVQTLCEDLTPSTQRCAEAVVEYLFATFFEPCSAGRLRMMEASGHA